MIPKQLQQRGIFFVLVKKESKKPFEIGWQKKKIEFDAPELLSHISNGGNYGVMGGGDKKLIVVDFDDEELQKKIIEKLPETFTIKTGSGLLHKYFFSEHSESFKIFDKDTKTLVDIQGNGKQVIGPNSIHPNKKMYEVVEDKEINFIPYSELKAILLPYDKKPNKVSPMKQEIVSSGSDFMDVLTSKVKVPEILSSMGVDTSKNPTECPFHSSKGGKCLGFTEETWHCFHCEEKGNIISLIKKYHNMGSKEAIEELARIGNLETELEESRKQYSKEFTEASKVFTLENQSERFTGIQPLFYDKSGMFWLWNSEEKYWELSDEVDILNMIYDSTGKDVISSKSRTEILNSLKQKGRLNMPKPIKPTWIQFKNKIYDVENGESFEASPDYFVTNPIPWEISGDPRTPNMDKIFKEWVGEEYVQTLYEILAYSLLPDYPINRLFCFIGAGMNGKSCFLNLLKKFIGLKNICATELDVLLTSRFEVTRLHKKLVCIMGETNFNEMSKTSIIKKLTGKDTIGFEYKNKNPFEDINYAKILIATNNLPTTTDKTIGFYRRWLIIDFPNEFSEKKDILTEIPEEEYNNLATNCIILLNKLLSKREFSNEGDIEERMRRYEDRSDPLEKFIKEFTTDKDVNSHIFKFEFAKKLEEWLAENKFRKLAEATIGKKMKQKGYESGQVYADWTSDSGEKKQIRAWLGLKWR